MNLAWEREAHERDKKGRPLTRKNGGCRKHSVLFFFFIEWSPFFDSKNRCCTQKENLATNNIKPNSIETKSEPNPRSDNEPNEGSLKLIQTRALLGEPHLMSLHWWNQTIASARLIHLIQTRLQLHELIEREWRREDDERRGRRAVKEKERTKNNMRLGFWLLSFRHFMINVF